MRRRLLELLCCPMCKAGLDLTVLTEVEQPISHLPNGPACSRRCHYYDLNLGEARNGPSGAECAACYSRDIKTGVLRCQACGSLFPISRGVPRLMRDAEIKYRSFFQQYRPSSFGIVESTSGVARTRKYDPAIFSAHTTYSFGLQWTNQHACDRTYFKDDATLRKDEFLSSLAADASSLQGKLVFDGGCGSGRLTASLVDFGVEIVGMDLSMSVERAESDKHRYAGERYHFVHFVQGNLMEMPILPESFDIIHTSGALQSTPNTERAFASFLEAAKPGGCVYMQTCRKREAWIGILNKVLRSVTSRLPGPLLYRLCWAVVPIHTALVLLVARIRGEESSIRAATHGEKLLSLFDNYSPRYQYRYTAEDLRRMFEAAGLLDVQDTTLTNEARHVVAFVGRKPPHNY